MFVAGLIAGLLGDITLALRPLRPEQENQDDHLLGHRLFFDWPSVLSRGATALRGFSNPSHSFRRRSSPAWFS
ncbi:MAG: hypothetical protein MZU97_17415 [Bacillus subtilis]|nr:hypothetical protein [Bacillus subtilis]